MDGGWSMEQGHKMEDAARVCGGAVARQTLVLVYIGARETFKTRNENTWDLVKFEFSGGEKVRTSTEDPVELEFRKIWREMIIVDIERYLREGERASCAA
jgi:hypothetical protein